MRVSHELRPRSAIEQPRGRFQALGRVRIVGMRYRLRTLLPWALCAIGVARFVLSVALGYFDGLLIWVMS